MLQKHSKDISNPYGSLAWRQGNESPGCPGRDGQPCSGNTAQLLHEASQTLLEHHSKFDYRQDDVGNDDDNVDDDEDDRGNVNISNKSHKSQGI